MLINDDDDNNNSDHVSIPIDDNNHHSHRVSRKLSEVTVTVPKRQYKNYDKNLFNHVVQDATRWACGVVFVEVWILDHKTNKLVRKGWSIEPSAYEENFIPLTDPLANDYLEPHPLAPGEGLPGLLFSMAGGRYHVQCTSGFGNKNYREPSFRMAPNSTRRHLSWYPVKHIANDPDQPHNLRLQHLGNVCGLTAAGVTFQVGSSGAMAEGVVVFLARGSSDSSTLCDELHINYMKHATMLIASTYAHREHRKQVMEARSRAAERGWKKFKNSVLLIHQSGESLRDHVEENAKRKRMKLERNEEKLNLSTIVESGRSTSITQSITVQAKAAPKFVCYQLLKFYKKCLGAKTKAPPVFSWKEAFWTFAGVFLTLSILTNINTVLAQTYGSDYTIVMGPFGALMTLQYGLTSAPASQPRNIMGGQIMGMLLAYGIGEIPSLPSWLRPTLATSIAVSLMVKLGVTHPPAGAAALLFAAGKYRLAQVGINLVANIIAIVMAVLVNNANKHRQYPTFWGLKRMQKLLFCIDESTNKEETEKKKT